MPVCIKTKNRPLGTSEGGLSYQLSANSRYLLAINKLNERLNLCFICSSNCDDKGWVIF